jgi:hypothetical protein
MTMSLGPLQYAWLKSIVEKGPTRHCMDGAQKALLRRGLAVAAQDGTLHATDLGRAMVRHCSPIHGKP